MLILILKIEQKRTYKAQYFNTVQCNDIIAHDTFTFIIRITITI